MDTPAAASGAAPRFGTRRLWIRIGVALAILVLLWSAAWFYVPPIVTAQASQAAEKLLGRRLTLGHVTFNPWTLELTIDDLALAGASAAAPPLLEVKRIHADAALTSLFRLAPVIDALEVDAPMVRVARVGDGRYDVDDVLQRLAAMPASDKPARFAVHNIVVRAGGADFADQPLRAVHRVRDLELGVPFISSLPSEREIKVEPHLAFALDGSRFDSAGAATPYAERGNGEVRVKLEGFAVAPYLGYVPRGLPAQLRAATLGADLLIAFEQRPKLSLNVSGIVSAGGLEVVDAASQQLLQVGNVQVEIAELRPLEQRVRVKSIAVEAPRIFAVRDAKGHVNLLLAAEAPSGAAAPVAKLPLPTTAASGAASAASPSPWRATVAALSVHAGQLDWRDATTSPAAALALTDFSLAAQAIAWPLEAPVVFHGEGVLGSAADHGKLSFSGQGNTTGADVSVALAELPLTPLQPYLRTVLAAPLAGVLSAEVAVKWQAGVGAPRLQLEAKRLALARLALGDAKTPDLSAELIEIGEVRADTVKQTASVGRLALRAPRLRVERDAAKHWSFERWAAAASMRAHTPAPESVAPRMTAGASHPASGTAASWQLALGELALTQGRVSFFDRAEASPVALEVADLAVQISHWVLDGTGAAPFHVAARVTVPAGPSGQAVGSGVVGKVDARGELKGFAAGAPTSAQIALLLQDLPLHLLDPYLDEVFNIDVQKAQTSFKGNLRWERRGAGSSIALRGDATVDDFRATSAAGDRGAPQRALAMVRDGPATGRQLLNWKSLSLRGIDVALAPGTATRLTVAETALSDFFARVVLDENGHLNLEDVARPTPVGAAASAAAAASAPAPARAVAVAPSASASTPAAIVNFGPISVVNGRVAYNDRFVKPNYNANLSELTGRLAAFSSEPPGPGQPPQLADLALKGRVEGTATLDISGKVNPLAKPLALDIQAKVRDLELPPLSPYAIKYSGYGIERGKMSVDLAYLVKPDGQLTASNKIVLNQLAFGDKVEGSTASLPVKLAVALLADRHGVIDLDLPVSGSINDPQFSLGGIIWKVITNLVVKAVTSPFSLLASAFGGGGSELSTIEFDPGTAGLTPAAKETLDKVAKALVDRPAVSLTVTGESRLDVEKDAWKQERLRQIVRAEKRRRAIAGGASADAEIVVGDAEYPELLKEVYKRADMAKPKNVIGLAKDLPTHEMETLLLTNIVVADDAMQQLAVRRGVAVRDYLATKEIAIERLFLGAPKVASEEGAWKPRADLKLAAN
jgi:uncharacterized protein involved in outer membrane biogenesis